MTVFSRLPFYCSIVAIGLGTLGVSGCHSTSPQSSDNAPASTPVSTAPPLNVVAIDRSGSTASMRDQQIAFLKQAVREGKARGEKITIWAVDKEAVPIMQPTTMEETFKLSDAALAELKTPPKDRATRTRPALFWSKMADMFSGQDVPNQTVRILYCTDGDNDWAGEAKDLEKAATRLAQNPRVSVGIAGLKPDETEILRKQFAAFGPNRSVFANPANQDTVIRDWRKLNQR